MRRYGLLFGRNATAYVRSWVFMGLLVTISIFYVGQEVGEILIGVFALERKYLELA